MPEPIRIRMDLTTARAVEFIDKLQNDNDFRAQLAANPREVLWEYGVEASPELIPETLTLPTAQQIGQLKSNMETLLADEETGVVAGPAMVFPLWTCVFSFPFLSGEES